VHICELPAVFPLSVCFFCIFFFPFFLFFFFVFFFFFFFFFFFIVIFLFLFFFFLLLLLLIPTDMMTTLLFLRFVDWFDDWIKAVIGLWYRFDTRTNIWQTCSSRLFWSHFNHLDVFYNVIVTLIHFVLSFVVLIFVCSLLFPL
jgi:hypothetical protein